MRGGNSMKSSTAATLNQRNLGPARQFTTGVPSPKPVLNTRYLPETNALLRRDPLSSYGTRSLHDNESCSDGEFSSLAHGMRSSQLSFYTLASTQSTASEPRKYFAHADRFTVENSQLPTQAAATATAALTANAPKAAAPSGSEESTNSKKRRLFNLGVLRKAVAGHSTFASVL
ncbi:hypothetical protein LTR12_018165 [Friedmanniomyces endolithicus]|nr:hypothetical protein LTS09_017977 [Friedmanniomyces endolithicus]KAK1807490.1 hypothetical protein LTR12_018165 [Friedmanniomyces endolithicus]